MTREKDRLKSFVCIWHWAAWTHAKTRVNTRQINNQINYIFWLPVPAIAVASMFSFLYKVALTQLYPLLAYFCSMRKHYWTFEGIAPVSCVLYLFCDTRNVPYRAGECEQCEKSNFVFSGIFDIWQSRWRSLIRVSIFCLSLEFEGTEPVHSAVSLAMRHAAHHSLDITLICSSHLRRKRSFPDKT